MSYEEWIQLYKAENASIDFPPSLQTAYEAGYYAGRRETREEEMELRSGRLGQGAFEITGIFTQEATP